MNLKLSSNQRLKSRQQIEQLFEVGKSAKAFPLRLRYMPTPADQTSKAAFAVPKRSFRLAVRRNRIKRLMKEAYRLEQVLLQEKSAQYLMLFIYTGKKLPTLKEMRQVMVKLLKQLE